MQDDSLGAALRQARAGLELSLQQVAECAGCSTAYVHKLEMDRVRTPSPRVLAGLATALGLPYRDLMAIAGYEPSETAPATVQPATAKRYSNAHIVQLLEELREEVRLLRAPV